MLSWCICCSLVNGGAYSIFIWYINNYIYNYDRQKENIFFIYITQVLKYFSINFHLRIDPRLWQWYGNKHHGRIPSRPPVLTCNSCGFQQRFCVRQTCSTGSCHMSRQILVPTNKSYCKSNTSMILFPTQHFPSSWKKLQGSAFPFLLQYEEGGGFVGVGLFVCCLGVVVF